MSESAVTSVSNAIPCGTVFPAGTQAVCLNDDQRKLLRIKGWLAQLNDEANGWLVAAPNMKRILLNLRDDIVKHGYAINQELMYQECMATRTQETK